MGQKPGDENGRFCNFAVKRKAVRIHREGREGRKEEEEVGHNLARMAADLAAVLPRAWQAYIGGVL